MLLSGSCCGLLALRHPGPSRGTYEMHLSTVCPGHKGGGSLYPSVANTTGQGWIYTGSFPHTLPGCIGMRARWVLLSGSCWGIAETLGLEARTMMCEKALATVARNT